MLLLRDEHVTLYSDLNETVLAIDDSINYRTIYFFTGDNIINSIITFRTGYKALPAIERKISNQTFHN